MFPQIQIAGIHDLEEATLVLEAGADLLAFPLGPGVRTPDVDTQGARRVIAALPPGRAIVITYHTDAESIAALCREVGATKAQLHAPISAGEVERLREMAPEFFLLCTLAIGEAPLEGLDARGRALAPFVDGFLLDTFDPATHARGATGKTHDWRASAWLTRRLPRPVMLAGGLTPENLAEAIAEVGPAGVDAHTGVEGADGRKAFERVAEFARRGRAAFSRSRPA